MPTRKKNIIEIDKSETNETNETTISNIIQTKANKNSPINKESKNKDDYCKELKNIAYKTILT